MDYSYLMVKKKASDYLAEKLNNGSLSLFLGAGVSMGIGLPNWVDLINNLINVYNKKPIKGVITEKADNSLNATELQKLAEKVIKKCGSTAKFHDCLEIALYPNSIDVDDYKTVLKSDLIIALGALLLGSKRGHVRNVITLNFDNVLEWYLSICGYVSNVVHSLPQLEGSEDVHIFHPHGYIPHPKLGFQRSDFTIIGIKALNKRLGTTGDLWYEKMRHLFRSGIFLFIGLSENSFYDAAIGPLIETVGQEVKKERPLGFWIILDKLEESSREDFLASNIVPLEIDNVEELSKFLFSICQKSSDNII